MGRKDLQDDEQDSVHESEMSSNNQSFEKLEEHSERIEVSSGLLEIPSVSPDLMANRSKSKSSTGSQQFNDVEEEEDDNEEESNKTQEGEEDQYRQAQSKKMFIIQEVDEDAFSERSMSKIERII